MQEPEDLEAMKIKESITFGFDFNVTDYTVEKCSFVEFGIVLNGNNKQLRVNIVSEISCRSDNQTGYVYRMNSCTANLMQRIQAVKRTLIFILPGIKIMSV